MVYEDLIFLNASCDPSELVYRPLQVYKKLLVWNIVDIFR